MVIFFVLIMGGFFTFLGVTYFVFILSESRVNEFKKDTNIVYFLITWAVIFLVYFITWYLTNYPGNMTGDTLSQIKQIYSGKYSNHHPYYHTLIIKLFFDFGYALFGNVNDAIAFYVLIQIFIVSFVFAFMIYTVFQCKQYLCSVFL